MTEIEYIQSQAVKMNRLRDLWKEIQIRQDIYQLPYGSTGGRDRSERLDGRTAVATAQKEYIDIMRRI